MSTNLYLEPVLVSAIEHYAYCPRQCGLIHLESVWDENVFTIRGKLLHERVDEPESRAERGVQVERALPIWSDRYGLIGKADVVEFHNDGTIMPVEYKVGRSGRGEQASLQMCAQAFCLEEMLQTTIERGAVFYAADRQRVKVPLTAELRAQTLEIIEQIRHLLVCGTLPPPVADARCPKCSLVDACLPTLVDRAKRIAYNPFVPHKEVELL